MVNKSRINHAYKVCYHLQFFTKSQYSSTNVVKKKFFLNKNKSKLNT